MGFNCESCSGSRQNANFMSSHLSICYCNCVLLLQHEEICSFPSTHFYEEKLKTDPSVINRKGWESKLMIWPRGPKYPIVFCDYVGVEERMLGSSKSNPQEAGKVVSTLYMIIIMVY